MLCLWSARCYLKDVAGFTPAGGVRDPTRKTLLINRRFIYGFATLQGGPTSLVTLWVRPSPRLTELSPERLRLRRWCGMT